MKKIYSFSEIIEKFFEPLIQKKNITLKALFPITFSSIFNIVSVYIIKEITNKLTNGFQEISFLVIILITLVLLNYIIIYTTKNWTHAVLWPELKKYIYSNYIPKYLYIDNNYIEKQGTGKLMTMIDKGVHSWVDLLNKFLEDVLPSIIMIISSFIFISFINIYYAFALVILFIFTLYFTYILQKKAKSLRIERRELNIALTRRFVKVLMTKFEILQNNKGLEETKNITDSLNKNKKINFKIRNLTVLTGIFTKFIIDGSKIFLIIIFGFGLFGNIINFGEFVALMSIAYILDQILSKFIFLYIDFTNIYDDIEKLWGFFDNAPMIKGYKNGKEFIYKKGDIDIVNLDFKYFKDKIYDNFNLKIGGGKKLAIVGPSGGGKTTLIKILSGYIHQNAGDILIDGQKLSEVSLKSYYKNIGYLTQEPSIFDGTIYENLTYAIYRELGDGELDKILKLSKCDFVHTYEKGLQTEIGERGIRLSGGQKQRLAIAKIMLKNPKIIFLDEPTSAMDSFNEDEVSEALYNLFKGKTVIIIAHRLQTVKHADRIIYIENGEIVEDGTHSELVKIGGKYKKMLDLQSGF
ncbi:MAG: ABC transporter ATP-binding protein [Candidatus Gracilibacteria bacterium]